MTIAERRVGDVTVLELGGRLVYGEGDELLRAHVNRLLDGGRSHIVIDLRDVTYVDSCGVGELVARLVSARRRGGDIRLLHLSARSHRVMQISRLLEVFEHFDSEEAALASFRQRGA